MKKAILFQQLDNNVVRCNLCAHGCAIKPDQRGKCLVRQNLNGKLFSLNYDKVIATHVDPIEKKPLFHFRPGSKSFSVATVGCNFTCTFCQNYDISQWLKDSSDILPGKDISPVELAKRANETDCKSMAFTYTEPTIFAELAYDTAVEARKLGIDSVFVSNGFMSSEMVEYFGDLITAANIDLKTFNDENYKNIIGGRLQPVLESIRNLYENKTFLEITTLIVPQFNDKSEELTEIAEFIADVDKSIPWHVSAFHPAYRMTDRDRTSMDLLDKAYRIGKSVGLEYVYPGNAAGDSRESTFCPNCNEMIIERYGFSVTKVNIKDNRCPNCNTLISGIF